MKIQKTKCGIECVFENGDTLEEKSIGDLVKTLKDKYGCSDKEINLALFNPINFRKI